MLILEFADVPGNEHDMHPKLPWKAVRSHGYRPSWATVIDRRHPQFGALVAAIPSVMRPATTFGAIGLESQEHSFLWAGDPAVITRIQDSPGTVDWSEVVASGKLMDRWPHQAPWVELMPVTTWNQGGEGIVTQYPVGQASVVVYELIATPAKASRRANAGQEPQPVVTFHCAACHLQDTDNARYPSDGPYARERACQAARRHLGECDQKPGLADRMEASVAATSGVPAAGYAARCATRSLEPSSSRAWSSCAEVRAARTAVARTGQG
jgi:hypothetical protein